MKRVLLNSTEYNENLISWQDRKDVISRSATFYGMIMTESLDLQFIQSAYDYIVNLDNLYDVAATCTIQIQNFDSIDGYTDDFTGLLDFATLKLDNKDTKKLTISAYSDSFSNKLLERSEISIPYDRLETLDGDTITPFSSEYEEVDIEGIEVVSSAGGTGDDMSHTVGSGYFGFTPGLVMTSSNPEVQSPYFRTTNGDKFQQDFFFISKYATTVIVDFTLNWRWTSLDKITLVLDRFSDNLDGTYTLVDRNTIGEYTCTGGLCEWTSTINETIVTSANEGLVLWYYNDSDEHSFYLYDTSTLNLTIIQKAPATPCNFVPPFEAGQRIIESITGQSTGLDSPILGRTDSSIVYDEDGTGSLLFLTNGKLIRQFPTGHITTDSEKKSQLSFSLSEWFESLDKVLCLGAGVKYEGGQYKLLVDDRKEFFKDEVILTITSDEMEVDSFTIEKDMSLYYNEIEVGSTYEKPEEISGLEEYNSKQNYSTPILNENKLDLLNQWVYAVYPFEFTRRKKYEGSETEDYKYDNNNFIFQVFRDIGFIQHTDEGFDEVNGLDNITTYMNLPITPKRILQNFDWWINAGLKGYQSDKLTYNKSVIVTDLSTRKTSEGAAIVENADVLISTLESPKFTGKIVRFSAPVNSATFKLIQANPYGLVKFYNPLTKLDGYMYIKEVSTSSIDKSTNWEGLETTGYSESGSYRLLQDGSYRLLEDGNKRLLE